jgi:hypothetical protein
MGRTPAESNHDSGKPGQCHRDLCSQTKSLAWFHRYCFYQIRRIMASRTQPLISPLARMLVRFDRVARFIVNANHSIM